MRWLYGRPLETLLATFGVSLILQQVVRDIFSANNRPVETPQWMAGSLEINEAFSITYNRLYVVRVHDRRVLPHPDHPEARRRWG